MKPTRVDKNQPTFSQPTPSYSGGGSGGGGGSMNILVLLSMILLVVGRGAMAKKRCAIKYGTEAG
ncbi:hypothetical protein QW180_30705 [Vibrio sinaloensis]|nr:hypothetical protein [Vibrio sinaloensis]